MKLKGVNPIERHIEKIVLGVVLLLLLGVLSMQFVLRPNDIDVGSRTVAPDQVYTVLEGQATQLQSQLTDQNPQLPELKPVDLVERYNHAFESATGGRAELSAALGEGVDIAQTTGTRIDDIVTPNDGPVAALRVPTTGKPVAASQWATLDPYAALQVPAYGAFVPAAQPFDFPSVTVEATFSGTDLQAALTGGGEGPGIPRRFWSTTGLAILGFEAQRQRRMPDGSWGEAEPIVTPPKTPMPTRALGEEAGLLELTSLVKTAAGVADEVARPMFPPTIAGEEWTPPSERVASADDSEATRIARIQRRLDRYRAELDRLNNPGAGPGGRPDPLRGPKTGDPGRGRDPRDPGGYNPNTTTNTRTSTSRIERLRKDIEDLEKQLKDLGVDTSDSKTTRQARTSRTDVRSVLEEASVDLWAHDLGVEPGATYRYRTRVVVNNPLFRKNNELNADDEAQQALALEAFSRGDWSEWSDPVVVGANEYYFVTSAEAQSGAGAGAAAGGPKATVELYKMFYGHYRKSTLSVAPGDELASTIRMSGNLLAFDTSTIEVGDAAKAVGALAEGEGSASALPAGISQLANRITIDLGVFLLDIYTGQNEATTALGQQVLPTRVVLRDDSGAVVVRSDLSDEASAAYAIASASSSSANESGLREPGAPAVSPAADLFTPVAP